MDDTFLVQQRLLDGSWYQVSEFEDLLNTVDCRDKCVAKHPDRSYRVAHREVRVIVLDV